MSDGQDIDCIIVGKNNANTLKRCIESVLAAKYTRGQINLFYVDRGSHDDSLEIARSISGVTIYEKMPDEIGGAPLVQMLLADAELDPDWFQKAMRGFTSETRAVRGLEAQKNPKADWYHWVIHLDGTPGDQKLFRRDAFDAEPETIDATMTYQETRVKGWEGYVRYCYHLGHQTADRSEILKRGGAFFGLIILTLILMIWGFWWISLFLPAAIVLLYPRIFRISNYVQKFKITELEAASYAWHRSLMIIPAFFGALLRSH